MNESVMVTLGWVANACFFSRFLVQWFRSERARKSVTPVVFWWLSVCGGVLGATYATWRAEPVLVVGHLVNLAIYARNLSLRGGPSFRGLRPRTAAMIAISTAIVLVATGLLQFESRGSSAVWIAVAVGGQSIWSSRFLLQWYLAERSGSNQLPPAFWWISLTGNGLLLAYTIQLGDPVLIAGYVIGPFVQVRNLMLGTGAAKQKAVVSDAS